MRILITGAGGPAGICFAKSLSEVEGAFVIGANAEDVPEAHAFVRSFHILPLADDSAFLTALSKIIADENVDVLIPTVDEELGIVSHNLSTLGCRVLISPQETIEITSDKARLYDVIPHVLPRHYDPAQITPGSFFIKPRRSRGSRDTHISSDRSALSLYDTDKYIVQELLQNPEVTVDALFDFDGKLVTAVPRERQPVEAISVRGKVFHDESLMETIRMISGKLTFIGPVNFQFMRGKDGWKLTEINSRASGGMGVTIAAGADIPKLAYELLETGVVACTPEIQEGEYDNFPEIIERQQRKAEGKL